MKNPSDERLTPHPSQFPLLEKIDLQREIHNDGGSPWNVIMTFCSPRPDTDTDRFVMTCTGVRDLKLGSLDGLWNTYIQYRSIKEDQLEDLNYEVWDAENEIVSLYCKAIDSHVLQGG